MTGSKRTRTKREKKRENADVRIKREEEMRDDISRRETRAAVCAREGGTEGKSWSTKWNL